MVGDSHDHYNTVRSQITQDFLRGPEGRTEGTQVPWPCPGVDLARLVPIGGVRERIEGAEGAYNPIRTTIATNQSSQGLNNHPSLLPLLLGGCSPTHPPTLSCLPTLTFPHIFCIHSTVEGHLGSFQLLAIINKAAMNIVEPCVLVNKLEHLLGICPGVETLILTSRVVVPVCKPTDNGGVFLFLHILPSICCRLSFWS